MVYTVEKRKIIIYMRFHVVGIYYNLYIRTFYFYFSNFKNLNKNNNKNKNKNETFTTIKSEQ